EEETDSDKTESDIIKILVLNQSNTEDYKEEEEENIEDDEKWMKKKMMRSLRSCTKT
nr:hypothetical protein [Tanacetum cinerariifolium]